MGQMLKTSRKTIPREQIQKAVLLRKQLRSLS